jgi:hypothetical protein
VSRIGHFRCHGVIRAPHRRFGNYKYVLVCRKGFGGAYWERGASFLSSVVTADWISAMLLFRASAREPGDGEPVAVRVWVRVWVWVG